MNVQERDGTTDKALNNQISVLKDIIMALYKAEVSIVTNPVDIITIRANEYSLGFAGRIKKTGISGLCDVEGQDFVVNDARISSCGKEIYIKGFFLKGKKICLCFLDGSIYKLSAEVEEYVKTQRDLHNKHKPRNELLLLFPEFESKIDYFAFNEETSTWETTTVKGTDESKQE